MEWKDVYPPVAYPEVVELKSTPDGRTIVRGEIVPDVVSELMLRDNYEVSKEIQERDGVDRRGKKIKRERKR